MNAHKQFINNQILIVFFKIRHSNITSYIRDSIIPKNQNFTNQYLNLQQTETIFILLLFDMNCLFKISRRRHLYSHITKNFATRLLSCLK